MRRNLGLRILSIVLALGLWLFVNTGQHGALENFTVPISYRNLPPHFLITNPHPSSVKIQVSGPRTLLSLIEPSRIALKIDLTGVAVGQASFKISPDSFNVPRQTSVTSISPSQLILDVDRVVTRDVPVRLTLTGEVTHGYRVASATANPAKVQLRGPSRTLSQIDSVATEPIDLTGFTTTIARIAPLVSPSDSVRLDPLQVAANVTFAQIVAQRQFRGVPITVRNSDFPVTLEPSHLNLTLRGPMLTLQKLDLAKAVFVDAEGISPGGYDVPVQISLPDGVDLIHQSAEKVRLHMYRNRRVGHG